MRSEAVAAFSGDRLRLARFRGGLTVKDLADRVGVTHSAVSQYETGRTRPTAATLAKLAIATGTTPDFFRFDRRPISSNGLDGTHFRSLRSTTKTVRSAAWAWSELTLDVADTVERYVGVPAVFLPERTITADDDHRHVVEAVNEVRQAWQVPEGPVGNLTRYLEAHGILVTRIPKAAQGVDAFSHHQGHRPVVVLGPRDKDAGRSRFDAAHELGHLVCHPEADPGGSQERQAHAFAAEFLMPAHLIIDVLPRRFDIGAYARLKHEWGVSIAALLYRARTLGVISEPAYRRSVVTMNKNYGRTEEPFPLRNTEQPELLRAAITLLTTTGRSIDDIASECCINVNELTSIAALHHPVFTPLIATGDAPWLDAGEESSDASTGIR